MKINSGSVIDISLDNKAKKYADNEKA